VRVWGFPAHPHSHDAVAATIQAIQELLPEVETIMVNESGQNTPALRQEFDIQCLPSLVIFAGRAGESSGDLSDGIASRLYFVIDDPGIMDDQPRLTAAVVTLVKTMEAATAREIAVAIRSRQFRMVIWKASSRAGWPIDYLQGITVRFVAGDATEALCFDKSGWAKSVTTEQPAAA
jgi:hypothetical protein